MGQGHISALKCRTSETKSEKEIPREFMGQLKYKNTSLSQVPLLISPKAESKVELGECWIQGYLEAAAGVG